MFRDRSDAGAQLAEQVAQLNLVDPIVFGLARGGIEVARQVADVLNAPLEVLVVRKIGHPAQQELAVGALAEGGVMVIDKNALEFLGVPYESLNEIVIRERAELQRRVSSYRPNRPMINVLHRNCVLVDDGIATGLTMRAAVQALRDAKAAQVVVATPVGAADVIESMSDLADDVVYVDAPMSFGSVGAWYESFPQLSDDDVMRLLNS